jgi:hypothetical protein
MKGMGIGHAFWQGDDIKWACVLAIGKIRIDIKKYEG